MSLYLRAVVAERGLDVEVRVDDGETVAVLGPNGAGKSTLFGVAAGLLRPDHGRAELNGRTLFDVTAPGSPTARSRSRSAARPAMGGRWLAPHQRDIALMAQEPLLFPHLTVLSNVAFGPRSQRVNKRAALDRAWRWLREVEADELAHRRPATLSGGQAQRIALARALAAEPQLLLLDEPMAALDVAAAPLLRRVLRKVLPPRSALIITHDILDALTLADRVLVLEAGRIVEEGPTRDVLERPRSAFAAGLAGLNLLTGTLTTLGSLTTDDGLDVAGVMDGPRAAAGHSAVAVFPPSAVSIFLDRPHGSPRNVFPAVITDLEPQGAMLRVHAGRLTADVTPAAAVDLELSPGQRVNFVVKAAEVKILHAAG